MGRGPWKGVLEESAVTVDVIPVQLEWGREHEALRNGRAAGRGFAIASEDLSAQYHRADLVFIPVLDLAPVEISLARVSDDERPHARRVFDVLVASGAPPRPVPPDGFAPIPR
jgi:hypothetical protein